MDIQIKLTLCAVLTALFATFLIHMISLFNEKEDRMPLILYVILPMLIFVCCIFVFFVLIPIINFN